uniref:Uncharacterized protein n=1 Tax=Leptobrachium leishanense TaxID=445787 RepID=A0A8C5MY43_9ANUR
MIAGEPYLFASVYLPNKSQCHCLSGILRKLATFQDGLLVLQGTLKYHLTRALTPQVGFLPSRIACSTRFTAYWIRTSWSMFGGRFMDGNETSRFIQQSTHLIPDWTMSSCLNMLSLVRDSEIEVHTWSDHAAVSDSLYSPLCVPNWQLNVSLLSDPQVLSHAQTLMSDFFQDNVTDEVPLAMIWEAHKACIHGFFISRGMALKRQHKAHLQTLLADVQWLQDEHIASGADEVYQCLLRACQFLVDQINADLKLQAVKSRAFFSLHENKPSRLLAQQLRVRRQRANIPRIHISASEITTHPARIVTVFCEFFQTLYSIQLDEAPAWETPLIRQYLDSTLFTHTAQRGI